MQVAAPVAAALGKARAPSLAVHPPPARGGTGAPHARPSPRTHAGARNAPARGLLLRGAEAARGTRSLGEVGAEIELEGRVLDGAGGDGHGLELGEL